MSALTPGFPPVPEFLPDEVEHRRKLARSSNLHNQGKFNASIDFTLTANAASSTLQDSRIGYYSTIIPMSMTAHAAAEIGNGTMYIQQTDMKSSQATITHANNSQTDRTFRFLIIG